MQHLALCIMLVLFPLLNPRPINAHFLETDGGMGAIIHITPEDDPVAGEPSDFFFEFRDTTKKFRAAECNCTITIFQNDKEIFSQELFTENADPSLSNASLTYTFPQKDIYSVVVQGTPKTPDAFTPFTLRFTQRVAREHEGIAKTASSAGGVHPVTIAVVAGVFAFIVAGFVVSKMKRPYTP